MSYQALAHAIAKLENTADGRPQELAPDEAAELLEYIRLQASGGRWLVVRPVAAADRVRVQTSADPEAAR